MAKESKAEAKETAVKKCGIVMPIAGFPGYTTDHWKDVKEIIVEAAEKAGFEANIVSYTNESTVIHKTIIQNLYDNEIVVVDVSGKNPNVMFELGMRLAFDKPTIIIKDDDTTYSFDTAPIEHLGYPGSLHYQSIKLFKEQLTRKMESTYEASRQPAYSSFLKNFGEFTIAHLDKKEIGETEFIVKAIKDLQSEIRSIRSNSTSTYNSNMYKKTTLRDWFNQFSNERQKTTKRISDLIATPENMPAFIDWLIENISNKEIEVINGLTPKDIHDLMNLP